MVGSLAGADGDLCKAINARPDILSWHLGGPHCCSRLIDVQFRPSLRGPVDRSPLARAPGAPGPQDLRLWGLGPGGVLAVGAQSRIWDLGPRSLLVLDTRGHLQESGPRLGFGAQGGLWNPEAS
jgi:hypothetical protein